MVEPRFSAENIMILILNSQFLSAMAIFVFNYQSTIKWSCFPLTTYKSIF
jgi:hypothetical protein